MFNPVTVRPLRGSKLEVQATMARKALVRDLEFPYHIVNRSNNREFFEIELETLWQIFLENLKTLNKDYRCKIHSFVLMSNHYHLLISAPDGNIDRAMQYLQRETARTANAKTGRQNHFFGTRYRWSVIRTENYYWNAMKYVLRNPVRSGLVENVEDYPFSSLNRENEIWNFPIPFCDHSMNRTYLEWLNDPFQNESEHLIRKALRRKEFQLPRTKQGRKPVLDAAPYKK